MLKIAICDDEGYFRKFIRQILTGYIERNGGIYEIDEFASGKRGRKKISSGSRG